MKKFTNQNVLKEIKNINKIIIIGIIIIVTNRNKKYYNEMEVK